jgi:hypothetical protein
VSDYAETVKTIDSMDSGVKYSHSHHPDPMSGQRLNVTSYSTPPTVHNGSHSYRDAKDRFPTPIKRAHDRGGRDTPQTTV